MLVYRVEHRFRNQHVLSRPFKVGPYSQAGWKKETTAHELSMAHLDVDHPCIYSDLAIPERTLFERRSFRYWLCACNSLDALATWFDNWWPALKESNFTVVRYEVDPANVMFGRSGIQVVFNYEKYVARQTIGIRSVQQVLRQREMRA